MDALGPRSRLRLAPILEWLIAAAVLGAAVSAGAMIANELKAGSRRQPARAALLPPVTVPAGVPARAVSIPLLPLQDGTVLQIGDTLASVAARLGRAAESGRQEVDRGSFGERMTRFYEYAGSRFILVFERVERQGDVTVAAIYLQ